MHHGDEHTQEHASQAYHDTPHGAIGPIAVVMRRVYPYVDALSALLA